MVQEAPIALLRMPQMPSEMGKSEEGVGSRSRRQRRFQTLHRMDRYLSKWGWSKI